MYLPVEEHEFITVYCAYCGNTHTAIKSCGKRFCPACGHINRWRVRERMHQIFQAMKHRKGYRLKMLTLSKQNCPNLKEGINDLIASFRRLRQRSYWIRNIAGGLFVIEVTGDPGNWHPHLHVFIYSRFVRWSDLHKHWQTASKGGLGVYIKNISNDTAIYYVTKYVTKSECDSTLLELIETSMKGRRLFQRFGEFQTIPLVKSLTGRICEKCGEAQWLTEYDIRKAEKWCSAHH